MLNFKHVRVLLILLAVVVIVAGCGNLREQPKLHSPYDESPTFGSAARDILPEAVPVGFLNEDTHLYEGTINGEPAETFPFEITLDVLEEGRRQYEGFCSPCHGYSGYGDGIIAQEGYAQPAPASYHIDRLRDAPNGYFFNVITNGTETQQMFGYSTRVSPENRWAIIAYIRALQYSQNVAFDDLPAEAQSQLGN